jgi:multicomponent Na+:H+ antiporter subunit D
MVAPAAALLVAAGVAGLAPNLAESALVAASRLAQPAAYAHAVLAGAPSPTPDTAESTRWSASAVLTGVGSALLAVAVAAAALGAGKLRAAVTPALVRAIHPLRRLHSGHPGDYVAWLAAGAATLAVVAVSLLR